MRIKLFFLVALFSGMQINAQSYTGYVPDNYAGVQGVLFNPASIVDSRFKADINLFSINQNVGNDMYGVNLNDVVKSDYDFDEQAKKYFSSNNNAIVSVDIMGPSFMFNIAPKHAVALYTRVRSISNVVGIKGDLVNELSKDTDDLDYFYAEGGSPNIGSNTWGEVGLSYAAVLLNSKQHFLKGGLTFKHLQGGFNAYINGEDISVKYVKNNFDSDLSTYTTTGELTYGGGEDYEEGFDDYEFNADSKGYGFDIGFQYEWRPDYEKYDSSKARPSDNNFKDLNKYKLRLGVSVTDIGSINYKNASQDTYDFNGSVTEGEINDSEDFYELLNDNYGKIGSEKGKKINLPTAIRANVDWNIYNKFYLNLNGDFSLVDKTIVNGIGIANSISVTPRYETKWFTFSIPVNHMEYSGTQVGTAIRLGPIFVGSSSSLTNLFSSNSKSVDAYVGIKIPIYQKKLKDADADDVLDKEDKCPKEAGSVENNGCPWPDTDADTVVDKDDKCPNEAGSVENNGCPWGDADNDTVLDNVDKCPSVAGAVENQGCPWPDADGDSVLDKDDKCPEEAGPVENGGCPVADTDKEDVKTEEVKTEDVKVEEVKTEE